MIFPELPRRTYFHTATTVKTPLHRSTQSSDLPGVEATTESKAIDVDDWFRQHGLATDPAASTLMPRHTGPIDWFARDAWEFYALCTAMITWIVYWYGVHRGAW